MDLSGPSGAAAIRIAISVLLAVAGVIHVLPLGGALGADRLAALYGLPASVLEDRDAVLLLRHRALLFGLLGGLLLLAAWKEALQPLAITAGLISAIAFLILARSGASGTRNARIQRVVRADVVAIACLLAAGALAVIAV